MNDFSHHLHHNSRVHEQETNASRNRFAYQNTHPVYKKWVANFGTVLVHIGTSLQNSSEFKLDTKFSITSEEC